MDEETEKIMAMEGKIQMIVNKTERPNSYEFGKAGNRFKLYFLDVDDLQKQLKNLVEAGLAIEEDFKN